MFILEFSNDDEITEVLFRQSKDYFITNMYCFIELLSDIKSSTQKLKKFQIKEIIH